MANCVSVSDDSYRNSEAEALGVSKLWQAGPALDEAVEKFTVGSDYITDSVLVNADCVASIAHAAMLESIGVVTEEEYRLLKRELVGIMICLSLVTTLIQL